MSIRIMMTVLVIVVIIMVITRIAGIAKVCLGAGRARRRPGAILWTRSRSSLLAAS